MTVTTRHPESRYGVPVVLNEEGRVLDTSIALRFFRRYYALSAQDFAKMCNATVSQVNGWEHRRTAVPVAVLNVMKDFLEDEKAKVMRGGVKVIREKLRSGIDLAKERPYAQRDARDHERP